MKKIIAVAAIAATLFSFYACKKKEEKQPVPQAPAQGPIVSPQAGAPGQGGMPPHGMPQVQKMDFKIVVPAEVKEAWSAVKLVVNDKKSNKQQEITVGIGKEINVPDSNLKIKVAHFLPDFKMTEQSITSASNDANNPSAGVIIHENGKQVFPATGDMGWLYSKFPAIHPFQHDRFEITLKEGVKK
jgi:hypothetical protein